MRRAIAVLAGIVVLGLANWTIWARERQQASGQVVLLRVAPVDPRSLMQGDYMALAFQLATDMRECTRGGTDGRVIVRVTDRGVASFSRCDDGGPLDPSEVPLRYRIRGGNTRFATNAFFFQEGQADLYEHARYGEFRVSPAGDLLLTGLRDEQLARLGPPPAD